eukprot:ctg_2867.g486
MPLFNPRSPPGCPRDLIATYESNEAWSRRDFIRGVTGRSDSAVPDHDNVRELGSIVWWRPRADRCAEAGADFFFVEPTRGPPRLAGCGGPCEMVNLICSRVNTIVMSRLCIRLHFVC